MDEFPYWLMSSEGDPRSRLSESLTYRWLSGILIALLLVLAGAWAKNVQDRLQSVEASQVYRGEQIGAMTQQLVDIKQDLADIKSLLRRR